MHFFPQKKKRNKRVMTRQSEYDCTYASKYFAHFRKLLAAESSTNVLRICAHTLSYLISYQNGKWNNHVQTINSTRLLLYNMCFYIKTILKVTHKAISSNKVTIQQREVNKSHAKQQTKLIRHSSSRICVKTALASLAESSCPVLKDTFVL